MAPIITLTTDFGLADAYVAAMKGVILGINAEVTLVDICHTIPPQAILQAAFVLSTAYPFFPQGTIHVVVVDPGVGTERRAVILKTPAAYFVAPDNGVLSYVIAEFSVRSVEKSDRAKQQRELGTDLAAVALTKSQFWRSPVSATFHGRDIFAPVAARLSLGWPATKLGQPITSLTVLPLSRPYPAADGSLVGHILHIDSFGNLITDIKGSDLLPTKEPITIEIGHHIIHGLRRTYANGSGLLALIGSSGYLEVSWKEGDAAARLNAKLGDEVKVSQPKAPR